MATQSKKSSDDNVLGITLWAVGILAVALVIAWAAGLL